MFANFPELYYLEMYGGGGEPGNDATEIAAPSFEVNQVRLSIFCY